jgi:hypothetical protein
VLVGLPYDPRRGPTQQQQQQQAPAPPPPPPPASAAAASTPSRPAAARHQQQVEDHDATSLLAAALQRRQPQPPPQEPPTPGAHAAAAITTSTLSSSAASTLSSGSRLRDAFDWLAARGHLETPEQGHGGPRASPPPPPPPARLALREWLSSARSAGELDALLRRYSRTAEAAELAVAAHRARELLMIGAMGSRRSSGEDDALRRVVASSLERAVELAAAGRVSPTLAAWMAAAAARTPLRRAAGGGAGNGKRGGGSGASVGVGGCFWSPSADALARHGLAVAESPDGNGNVNPDGLVLLHNALLAPELLGASGGGPAKPPVLSRHASSSFSSSSSRLPLSPRSSNDFASAPYCDLAAALSRAVARADSAALARATPEHALRHALFVGLAASAGAAEIPPIQQQYSRRQQQHQQRLPISAASPAAAAANDGAPRWSAALAARRAAADPALLASVAAAYSRLLPELPLVRVTSALVRTAPRLIAAPANSPPPALRSLASKAAGRVAAAPPDALAAALTAGRLAALARAAARAGTSGGSFVAGRGFVPSSPALPSEVSAGVVGATARAVEAWVVAAAEQPPSSSSSSSSSCSSPHAQEQLRALPALPLAVLGRLATDWADADAYSERAMDAVADAAALLIAPSQQQRWQQQQAAPRASAVAAATAAGGGDAIAALSADAEAVGSGDDDDSSSDDDDEEDEDEDQEEEAQAEPPSSSLPLPSPLKAASSRPASRRPPLARARDVATVLRPYATCMHAHPALLRAAADWVEASSRREEAAAAAGGGSAAPSPPSVAGSPVDLSGISWSLATFAVGDGGGWRRLGAWEEERGDEDEDGGGGSNDSAPRAAAWPDQAGDVVGPLQRLLLPALPSFPAYNLAMAAWAAAALGADDKAFWSGVRASVAEAVRARGGEDALADALPDSARVMLYQAHLASAVLLSGDESGAAGGGGADDSQPLLLLPPRTLRRCQAAADQIAADPCVSQLQRDVYAAVAAALNALKGGGDKAGAAAEAALFSSSAGAGAAATPTRLTAELEARVPVASAPFQVDVLLRPEMDVEDRQQGRYASVAVEVDGPTHYSRNAAAEAEAAADAALLSSSATQRNRRLLGSTRLRDALLRASGVGVVAVPFFSWRGGGGEADDAHARAVLRRAARLGGW